MAPPARGSRPRHVPQRTCVACRQTNAKRQLVRIVRTPEGGVTIDPTGKRSGRGAYLCDSPECWQAGLKRGVIPRALKMESIPEHDLQTLNAYAQRVELRPEFGASRTLSNRPGPGGDSQTPEALTTPPGAT